MNTIGQKIGIVSHSCKISQSKGGPSTVINIKIDFSTATDQDIISWLVSNRAIAGQRPWRDLSMDELNELNGQTFVAQSIGQKVKSRQEKIQALVNAGLPEALAMFSVDNPEEFNKVVGQMSLTKKVEPKDDSLESFMDQEEGLEEEEDEVEEEEDNN